MDFNEDRITKLEIRVKKLEDSFSGVTHYNNITENPKERFSITEFLNSKKLENDVKRTLTIIYWLGHFEKLDSVSVADIQDAFRVARLKLPSNVNDKVNMNIKNGHLAEERVKKGGKKAWYITNTGAQHVEEELNK